VRRITRMGGTKMFDFCPASEALFSALRAGILSFASPKESSQRKGDPRVGAGQSPVPCATRNAGRLAKLACGSDNASRLPPAFLRCSAPLMGTRKASRNDGSAQEQKTPIFSCCPPGTGQNEYFTFHRDAFPGPHVERRATELMAERGRGLSEARRAEFRSPRQQRVAQGSRRSRPRSLGSPSSLATFFLAKQEESTPALKAEPPRQTNSATAVAKTKASATDNLSETP
jgi:hypothetical protein